MPSNAFSNRLETVLADADELNAAHAALREPGPGRQYGLGALNRAVVVMCVSAWETYLEELAIESVTLLRPNTTAQSVWLALNASVRSQVGRFNNPNLDHTRSLLRDAIGIADISQYWRWQHMSFHRAQERLQEAITLRHEIAHGTVPRPIIHNQQYARRLPGFFRKLGQRSDFGISDYLSQNFGVNTGW